MIEKPLKEHRFTRSLCKRVLKSERCAFQTHVPTVFISADLTIWTCIHIEIYWIFKRRLHFLCLYFVHSIFLEQTIKTTSMAYETWQPLFDMIRSSNLRAWKYNGFFYDWLHIFLTTINGFFSNCSRFIWLDDEFHNICACFDLKFDSCIEFVSHISSQCQCHNFRFSDSFAIQFTSKHN